MLYSHKTLHCVQAERGQHIFNIQPCNTLIEYKLKHMLLELLVIYRGSYMSGHVLSNLLNELGKGIK